MVSYEKSMLGMSHDGRSGNLGPTAADVVQGRAALAGMSVTEYIARQAQLAREAHAGRAALAASPVADLAAESDAQNPPLSECPGDGPDHLT